MTNEDPGVVDADATGVVAACEVWGGMGIGNGAKCIDGKGVVGDVDGWLDVRDDIDVDAGIAGCVDVGGGVDVDDGLDVESEVVAVVRGLMWSACLLFSTPFEVVTT